MRILLCVDGSNSSDAVITEASWRPWPERSRFKVVTAVDKFAFTKAPLLLEEVKNNTLETLKAQSKRLADAGWSVESEVILDNARHGLTQAANNWGADLVMLGTHGRGAMERLVLGSTAQAVMRHAECSVEIVRRQRNEEGLGMKVLVPTDGSEFAEWALQSVATRPWPTGSEFEIIACPEYPVLVGEYPYYPSDKISELIKTSTEHAEAAARKGEECLTKSGLKVRCEVTPAQDRPATAILGSAEEWKADLIVMGSHGRRGFDRLILGSVSETVALHARCSVEVARRKQPLL